MALLGDITKNMVSRARNNNPRTELNSGVARCMDHDNERVAAPEFSSARCVFCYGPRLGVVWRCGSVCLPRRRRAARRRALAPTLSWRHERDFGRDLPRPRTAVGRGQDSTRALGHAVRLHGNIRFPIRKRGRHPAKTPPVAEPPPPSSSRGR